MWQLFPLMGITSALRTNCRAVISKAARILLDVSKNTARSIDAVSSLNVPSWEQSAVADLAAIDWGRRGVRHLCALKHCG